MQVPEPHARPSGNLIFFSRWLEARLNLALAGRLHMVLRGPAFMLAWTDLITTKTFIEIAHK
jgi:hypothetical protein